ncbi:hypothetical protein TNCV_4941151 [Trichonephila clavipes]|nr:hypothetical protein TNCV_4941151 [Trichonephila clavipes]
MAANLMMVEQVVVSSSESNYEGNNKFSTRNPDFCSIFRSEIIAIVLLSGLASRKSVCLYWIPSHVGLYGNEIADTPVRNGCDLLITNSSDLSPLEIHSLHKSKLLSPWRFPPDRNYMLLVAQDFLYHAVAPGLSNRPWRGLEVDI